jgi:hypothetical protein
MQTVTESTSLLSKFKHHTGLDRAIAFSVLGRGWSALSGVVSIALIARFLSGNQQGYYYTFYSLVGLQIIFELGFSFVILQLAAHERARLTIHADGRIEGDERSLGRLASILQRSIRWYGCGALLLASSLGVIGMRFFSKEHGSVPVAWQMPWILVCVATSITFQIDPVISFLEGCGKVVGVGKLRFAQGVVGSSFAWTALVLHQGLFSPSLMIFGQASAGGFFLFKNRNLLRSLLMHRPAEHTVSWRREIWPFQWRIAVSWASAYFIWQILNPIVFAFRGPVEAGRLGMSLNVANSIGAVALSWVTTKAAPFGALIARREFQKLDSIFFRALRQSSILLLSLAAGFSIALPVVFRFFPHFRDRILPQPYFACVLLTAICSHVVVSEAYYLRSHKREPFLFFWVAIAILSTTGVSLAARFSNVYAVVLVYFFCSGILRLGAGTYLFFKKRAEWHAPGYAL